MGGARGDAAELVDRFLRLPKQLQGVPAWKNAGQHGEARIVWPVLVEHELASYASYELKAYPRERPPRFRIILSAPYAVLRIDFDCEPFHVNALPSRKRPPDLPYQAGSRHYHAWEDNRYLATTRSPPKEMVNARDLPSRLRNFDDVQRWFCEKAGIDLAPDQVVELPPSDMLL